MISVKVLSVRWQNNGWYLMGTMALHRKRLNRLCMKLQVDWKRLAVSCKVSLVFLGVTPLSPFLTSIIFTFTFFSLCVRPVWPVGCSLVSPYKLARIKGLGVTTVSPVLVQSSFETIQWCSRRHLVVWQIIPQGYYTEREECKPGMWCERQCLFSNV